MEGDESYVAYLRDKQSKLDAIVALSRDRGITFETIDLRRNTGDEKLREALAEITGADFPAELIEFRGYFTKIYFRITGMVGVTSTFKGLVYFERNYRCSNFTEETEERTGRLFKAAGEPSSGQFSALKAIDDKWCIFYSLEVD